MNENKCYNKISTFILTFIFLKGNSLPERKVNVLCIPINLEHTFYVPLLLIKVAYEDTHALTAKEHSKFTLAAFLKEK